MYRGIALFASAIATLAKAQPPIKTTDRGVGCAGQECGSVERGMHAFLDREPDGLPGNGRACADCRRPTAYNCRRRPSRLDTSRSNSVCDSTEG